ncbi:MAG TPA: TIGR01459 family HAD-type hydrolase [Methyloceanibacter sp.]|jgi:HAD superfamily hydrolase (TIGR01459 family)|nr:TIGR01459 family HAD-type hydrolase [Methyloceanibacter sp.]
MTLGAETIPVLSSIEQLGSSYAAWLVDIWGVMHNGVRAFPDAVDATRRFRERGGVVVLLSNSPRPSAGLQRQLRSLGVVDQSYDATVSSGDLTRHELAEHAGARVFHLGPERDLPIFAGIDVTRVDAADAELMVCTGLFDDETETPEDYELLLKELADRKLTMLCANPDHLVERGHRLVYCAGALAQIYAEDGGEVIYAGKPYRPIYELAEETIAELAGRKVTRGEILAIGDGIRTDMAGAADFGLDAVFVASGLHVGPGGQGLDDRRLTELFEGRKPPRAAMPALAW